MTTNLNTTTSLDMITVPSPADLAQQLNSDALVTWSDERRLSFVKTFKDRVTAARYILISTAMQLQDKARRHHYISAKHVKMSDWDFQNLIASTGANYRDDGIVGSRSKSELQKIAAERVVEVMKQLPGMTTAVRVLSPEAAGWIEHRDKLIAKGNNLVEAAKEVSGPLDLNDFPETTTLKQIRKLGADREAKRIEIKHQLDKIGTAATELDSRIDKFLYDGLPGLSDAVINLIHTFLDKATAFQGMTRRIEEQVMYGDSAAALELLRNFENDEAKVSEEVKTQFDEALAKLRAGARRRRSC